MVEPLPPPLLNERFSWQQLGLIQAWLVQQQVRGWNNEAATLCLSVHAPFAHLLCPMLESLSPHADHCTEKKDSQMRHAALWRFEYVPKSHQSHWRSPEGYHLQLEVLVHFLQSRGQRTPPQNALVAHNMVPLREEILTAKVSVKKSNLAAKWLLLTIKLSTAQNSWVTFQVYFKGYNHWYDIAPSSL